MNGNMAILWVYMRFWMVCAVWILFWSIFFRFWVLPGRLWSWRQRLRGFMRRLTDVGCWRMGMDGAQQDSAPDIVLFKDTSLKQHICV